MRITRLLGKWFVGFVKMEFESSVRQLKKMRCFGYDV